MLNLAPIRYAGVMGEDGGPVGELAGGPVRVGGESLQQVTAVLERTLGLPIADREVFGQVDGCGTHRSALLARYMAISEALERWAYHGCYGSGQAAACGLELDPTSSGMAAYPGLWRGQARVRARSEAVERWCLASWWEGFLGHDRLEGGFRGTEGIRIHNPLSRGQVVVLWRRAGGGPCAYGYAAGRTVPRACWRALVELERAAAALQAFHRAHPGFGTGGLGGLANELERRVVYFSLPDGHQTFRERLARPAAGGRSAMLRPLFDREVRGPWSRFATVWRVIYPPLTTRHFDPDQLSFFW